MRGVVASGKDNGAHTGADAAYRRAPSTSTFLSFLKYGMPLMLVASVVQGLPPTFFHNWYEYCTYSYALMKDFQ